jgi:CBS domain-containing protein
METVKDILERKGAVVRTIGRGDTVYEAVRRMDEFQVGALLVVEGGKLAGIITERDYARKVILKGKSSAATLVDEIMSHRVTHVGPGDTVERCMELMTERKIRHLPVLDHGKVAGMISMRDLMASRAAMNKFIFDRLNTPPGPGA